MEVTVKVVDITPSIAAEMLAKNTNNRALKPSVVEKYKRDLLSGKWIFGTSAIRVASDGTLLDGQHRLKAIIDANVTVKMVVINNMSKDAIRVIDSGSSRSVSDMFKIEGSAYANSLGGIITRHRGFLREKYDVASHVRYTHQEIWDIYQSDIAVYDDAAKRAAAWAKKCKIIPPCLLGALYIYLTKEKKHPENKVNLFIEQLCDIVPSDNETFSTFRRIIINYRLVGKKLTEAHLVVYIIRAWNAYLKDRTLKAFKNMDPSNTDVWFL